MAKGSAMFLTPPFENRRIPTAVKIGAIRIGRAGPSPVNLRMPEL